MIVRRSSVPTIGIKSLVQKMGGDRRHTGQWSRGMHCSTLQGARRAKCCESPVAARGRRHRRHRRGARRERRREVAWRAAIWRARDARRGCGTRTGQRCVLPARQRWLGAARSALAAVRRGRRAVCWPVRDRQWWRCGSGSCVDPARPDALSGVCVAGAGVAACVAGTIDGGVWRRGRRSSACVAEEEDGGAWRRSAWRRPRRSGELVAHGDAEWVLRKTACVAEKKVVASVWR